MAKKRVTIESTVPDSVLNSETGDEQIVDFGETDGIIEQIKAKFGGSLIKTKVYKVYPGKSEPSFCFQSNESVDEEMLQSTYGGGRYALRFFVDGLLKHTEFVEIADPPANTPKTPATVEQMQVQMMQQQLQFTQNMLLNVLGNRPAHSTPLGETVEAIKLLGGNGNGGGFDKLITIFEKGLEIGANKGGDMDWKGMAVQAIRDVVPAVSHAIASVKGGGVPSQPGVVPVPGIPSGVSEAELIKQGLTIIKPKILQGVPVGLALDWLVANAADYQQYLSVLLGKSFEDLCKVDPELSNEPYNTWFRQLLEGLREHFKESGTVDAED